MKVLLTREDGACLRHSAGWGRRIKVQDQLYTELREMKGGMTGEKREGWREKKERRERREKE